MSAAHPLTPLLALIEAVDRHGIVQARLPVTQWPVTVGRDLHNDLVLDDTYVAGQHLRLEQVAPGQLRVEVLDTANGVTLGRRHHERGAQFDWPAGQPLALGRSGLRARLADTPAPAEQRLPQLPWRTTAVTVAGVALVLAWLTGQAWLSATEIPAFQRELPSTLLGALAGLGTWAGLWALVTKLFSGHPQFWRHVRIVCALFVVTSCADILLGVLAFAYSWESLTRYAHLVTLVLVALGVHRHLLVVAPLRHRGLGLTLALTLALGLPTVLGTQWLRNKRLSGQLYMSQLYPPSWRVATPVPVAQFLREAASIEQRLATRLKDAEEDDAPDIPGGDD